MNLSTSLSSLRTIVTLLFALGIAYWASYAHIRWVQVENQYFNTARKISDNFATELKRQYDNKVVIFGGSTVRTSYIPSVFEQEYGIPVVNEGLHAGFGADVITELATEKLTAGDTLVVALEPNFLVTKDAHTPTAGTHFYISQHGLDFAKNTFFSLKFNNILSGLKGSTRYSLFALTKHLRGQRRYRYNAHDNLHTDGWMEVQEKRPLPPQCESKIHRSELGDYGKKLLGKLKETATNTEVQIYYAIPPSYNPNINTRYANALLILDIMEIMPVLRDPLLGVNPNANEFTDTAQHPSRLGAERATRSLGKALGTSSIWTKDELNAILSNAQSQGRIEGF